MLSISCLDIGLNLDGPHHGYVLVISRLAASSRAASSGFMLRSIVATLFPACSKAMILSVNNVYACCGVAGALQMFAVCALAHPPSSIVRPMMKC